MPSLVRTFSSKQFEYCACTAWERKTAHWNIRKVNCRLKEGNVLFNDALNALYFTVIWHETYGKGPLRDNESGNLLLPIHGLNISISSKRSHRQDITYHSFCYTSPIKLAQGPLYHEQTLNHGTICHSSCLMSSTIESKFAGLENKYALTSTQKTQRIELIPHISLVTVLAEIAQNGELNLETCGHIYRTI